MSIYTLKYQILDSQLQKAKLKYNGSNLKQRS